MFELLLLALTFIETALVSAISKFVMPALAAGLFVIFLPFVLLVATVSAIPRLLASPESAV